MLDEIARAHRVLADRPRPELATALRLARHRWACMSAENRDAEAGGGDPHEALDELLSALDKTGDREAVARVADLLRQAAAQVDQDSDSGACELVMIVQTLAGVGQVDQAEQLIAAVPDPRTQGQAQSLLAQLLAMKGDFPRAEHTINAITDADLRSTAWIQLVSPLTEAGDRTAALRAVQRAEEAIAGTDAGEQSSKLNHLVQALLPDGDPAVVQRIAIQAEEVALTLSDPHDHDWECVSAVYALALTGQFDRAEHLIPGIADRAPRELAMLKLVDGLAGAGDFDRGLRVAAGITDADTRSNAQGQLVGSLAEAGDVARAEATAAAITSPSARATALNRLAGALIEAGDQAGARPVVQDAERAVATIEHPATRSLTRQRLVQTLIEAGDFEQAELTALAAIEGSDPDFDLNRLAEGMIDAGDLIGARRVVELAEPFAVAITDGDARAWSLSSLAANYFAVGATDDAVRLLVDATGGGPWYRTLSTVAAVDPDAIRAVAEDLLNEETPNGA